jgi:hypothetical protein
MRSAFFTIAKIVIDASTLFLTRIMLNQNSTVNNIVVKGFYTAWYTLYTSASRAMQYLGKYNIMNILSQLSV